MDLIRKEKALNIPNLLTVIRMLLLPVIVWRYRQGDSLGALAVYLLAMLTDAADGLIARRFNQITSLGKLLDPLADKLSLLTLLGLFVSDGQIPSWLLGVVLFKEAALIFGSGVALHCGFVVSALPIGKVTTLAFVLSVSLRFLALQRAADALLSVSVVLSLAALAWYSLVVMAELRHTKRTSESYR